MILQINNYWKNWDRWIEFKLFDFLYDYEYHHLYITILNFEFAFSKKEI